jgi:hypothetical protein
MAGNKAFYANKRMFQDKLLSKRSKLKLYWSVIRPVVTYTCETWVLKEKVIQKLMIFERIVLRKIFGTTKQQNGLWRIKTNEELDKLIKHKNIIRFIKAQRLNWLGHIERMSEERVVKKINNWKAIGRPKNRWDDDVRNDIKIMKVNNWKDCAKDRNKWKSIVEWAKTLPELWCRLRKKMCFPHKNI